MIRDISQNTDNDTSTRVLGMLADFPSALCRAVPVHGMDTREEPFLAAPVLTFGASTAPVHSVIVRMGTQPAVQVARTPDGSYVIVDGEICNLNELGCTRTHGNDAERLLALYRQHGATLFPRLDAAAGITLFDAPGKVLYILRDPIGSAAMFYSETGGCLRWSSGIRGLVSMGLDCQLDPAALDFYITSGYLPAPWTMIGAIRKLPPGHMLVARAGQALHLEAYSRPESRPALTPGAEEIVEQLGHLMPRAVKRRCRNPAGTALLLSGGVDSMILAALMKEHAQGAVETFTFRYLNYEGAWNEQAPASACAAHLGLKHHVIEFGPDDVVSGLKSMLSVYGEPFSYGLHSFRLKGIRELGFDSVLCGTGADGWFPGKRDEFSRRILSLPKPVQGMLRAAAAACAPVEEPGAHLGGTIGRKRNIISGGLWTACTGLPYNPGDYITGLAIRRDLYANPGMVPHALAARRALLTRALQDYADEDPFHRFRFMSLRFYGAEMMQNWNHWSGRAHGLGIRTPYYDRELLGFVHRLTKLGAGKKELRQYAATLLPQAMAFAPKVPQSVPLDQWLRNAPLREFVSDSLCETQLRRYGLFDPAAVAQLLTRHMQGQENHAWTIWALLTVTLWQNMMDSWSLDWFFRREAPAKACSS